METVTSQLLLQSLRDCGLYSSEQLAAAESLLSTTDPHTASEQLWELDVLTEYQHRKIRAGKAMEIVFGPYLILDKLGEGGMGKVYKAINVRVGRVVALKTIRQNLMTNKVVLKRYEREAKAASQLNHPNVCSIYDAAEINGRYFLELEYVDGIDLSRIVKEFGHPPQRGLDEYQEACEYVRQAALGLQAAHDQGLVHRDIKPSNLLVYGERPLMGTGGKAILKILDMGLVRTMFDNDDATRTELTRDGTVVGTPDYMAPEQAKNSSTVDHRADLYALGCTLFFLLRGQAPFPEGNPIDKLIRHQLDEPPDLRRLRPDVPDDVFRVVDKLLKKKPDERYQRASDVAAALVRFTPDGVNTPVTTVAPSYRPFSFEPDAPVSGEGTPAASSSTVPTVAAAPKSGVGPGRTNPDVSRTSPSSNPKIKRRPSSSGSLPARSPAAETPPAPAKALPVTPHVRVVPTGTGTKPTAGEVVEAEVVNAEAVPHTPPPRTRRHAVRTGRTRRKQEKEKLTWTIGGLVVGAIVLLALAIVFRPGSRDTLATTPATTPSTAGNKPPPSGYAHLPPVGQMMPPGAVAALVAYPKPFWSKADLQFNNGGAARRHLEAIAKRSAFNPRQFDRTTVSFTAKQGQYTAAGEGTALTPEWFAGLSNLRANEFTSPKDGTKLLSFVPPGSGPRYGVVVADRAYAIADEAQPLVGLVLASDSKSRPLKLAGPNPDLVGSFPLPDTANLPLAKFVATDLWHLPLTGTGTLAGVGVRKLDAEVRVGEQIELTLVLTGTEERKLKEFVNVTMAVDLKAQNPGLEPITTRIAQAKHTVLKAGGEVEMRLTAQFTWAEVVNAIEQTLTIPPVP